MQQLTLQVNHCRTLLLLCDLRYEGDPFTGMHMPFTLVYRWYPLFFATQPCSFQPCRQGVYARSLLPLWGVDLITASQVMVT
jgi:hypothetical protein